MSDSSSDPFELAFESIEHETELAYLIKFPDFPEPIWIPKSKVLELEDGEPDNRVVTLPEWLAIEKGLV